MCRKVGRQNSFKGKQFVMYTEFQFCWNSVFYFRAECCCKIISGDCTVYDIVISVRNARTDPSDLFVPYAKLSSMRSMPRKLCAYSDSAMKMSPISLLNLSVFLTHWQKCCKILWVNEFYKIIARMIFSGRLKGGQKKWRRERDSNPRIVAHHHISNVAPSTTRPSLRF